MVANRVENRCTHCSSNIMSTGTMFNTCYNKGFISIHSMYSHLLPEHSTRSELFLQIGILTILSAHMEGNIV